MPLWRDPLDELIIDLERALPPPSETARFDMPPFEDFQLAIHAALQGGEELARADGNPRIQAVWSYFERLARKDRLSTGYTRRVALTRAGDVRPTDCRDG